ncbi:soluble lytic murein transglycosylase-like protein [Oxalobacteraceae bacterium GrIS 1.11]
MSGHSPRGRGAAARLCAGLLAGLLATPAAACWEEAGAKYGVNPYLLYAIAKTESHLNPLALNRANGNGSYDVGLMQINSSWLPTLRKYGIEEKQLYDACTSIHVGAWILSQNMRRLGNSWAAVGAYNARSPTHRLAYALKVYKNIPPAVLEARAQ